MDLALVYNDANLAEQALQLAHRLHLPVNGNAQILLELSQTGLALRTDAFQPLKPILSEAYWQQRLQANKKLGLLKACHPLMNKTIIDATAGWGKDAAILASFGAKVLMLERNPIIHALLEDALEREGALNLQLLHIDALSYFKTVAPQEYPAIVYCDPMHPERKKSASVKKNLQILQALIGPDPDAKILIEQACHIAREKVVVKWPVHLKPLYPPTYSIPGKTMRFDVIDCRTCI